MSEQKLVPELRFPEFEGEWESKTLGDFMSFKNGINADKGQYGHGRKFINVLDIIADKPIYHDQIIGSVSVSDKEFEKNEVKYGDILFQRSSETREEAGQSNIYLDKDKTATFGGFVIRGRPTVKFNPMYFDSLLKTSKSRKEITTKSGGSTRFNVGQESLSSVSIILTTDLEEQQKIADFLSSLDAKLAKLGRIKALLEDYKRGLMQQIFSQKLRFKRDDGSEFPEWEIFRFSDLYSWVRTNNLSREYLTNQVGRVQNIHYGDIHTRFPALFKQSDLSIPYIESETFISTIQDEEYCRAGDIVIADASEDYLDIGKAIEIIQVEEHSLVAGLHTYIARPKKKLALGFSSYLMRSSDVRKSIQKIAQGVSVLGISKTNIGLIEVRLPIYEEQQKIANFLSSCDQKIDVMAKQIEQLESFKKGLLQKLFV